MSTDLEISSWHHFSSIVGRLDVGDPLKTAYAFRGQADASWELEPTLLRLLRHMQLSEKEALDVEQRCLNEFKSQAHLHIAPNILSTTPDTVSRWTLMQQHGAPTRLLDWCGSMYVAAYFAVTGHLDSPGAVWIVNISTVKRVMKEKYGELDYPSTVGRIETHFLQDGAPSVLHFAGRLTKTARMVAQQGSFSVCRNLLSSHGEILRDTMPEESEKVLFIKLVIPSPLKNDFLRNLRKMNITANSLFPGLDGLGKSIGELIQARGRAPAT